MADSPHIHNHRYEEIAQSLLDGGFLLTALEFHQELIEEGIDVPLLRRKFDANPDEAVLRRVDSKQATEPTANVSASHRELLKERDDLKDKLAQAQAELREAKANISNLKFQLAKHSAPKAQVGEASPLNRESTERVDVKAMNYLVRNYLVENGFKLSAISFDQEIDDDLSDWNIVGLQIPEPPGLLDLFRIHKSSLKGKKMDVAQINIKNFIPPKSTTSGDKPTYGVGGAIKIVGGYSRNRLAFNDVAPEYEATTEIQPEDLANHARITKQLQRIIALDKDETALVKIAGESLPNIISGVILKKREEVLPVLISVLIRHPDEKTRFTLTQLLFNLIKKPNEYERKMILDGLIALAKIIGEERIIDELLPQCYGEITNKHPERRILVAESSAALASFIRSELRPSLIFSILTQLTSDKDGTVREAVARNLGLLISLFQDEEKYSQVEILAFQFLFDSEAEVRNAAQKYVFPFLGDWADMLGVYCTKYLQKFLDEINTIVSKPTFAQTNTENDNNKLNLLFATLASQVPRLRETTLLSAPFIVSTLPTDRAIDSTLTSNMDKHIQITFEKALSDGTIIMGDWPGYEWLHKTFLGRLISMVAKVPASSPAIVGFVSVISKLLNAFGSSFTQLMLAKLFVVELSNNTTVIPVSSPGSSRSLTEGPQPEANPVVKRRNELLPLYLGVLANTNESLFSSYLKEVVVNIATQEQGWTREQLGVLRESVKMVCKSTSRTAQVLNVLWDLLVNPANRVRVAVVQLFNSIVNVLSPDEVGNRVLPALVTLASDPDKAVNFATLKALGNVAIHTEDYLILDKISFQLNSFLEDETRETKIEVAKMFAAMIPSVQPRFRDSFILPKLVQNVHKNRKNQNQTERAAMAQLLFDCFRAFHGCFLDEEAIRDHILPGLKALQTDADIMDPSFRSLISAMINDMEGAIKEEAPSFTGGITPKTPGLTSVGPSTVNVGAPRPSPTVTTAPGAQSPGGQQASYFKMGMDKLSSVNPSGYFKRG